MYSSKCHIFSDGEDSSISFSKPTMITENIPKIEKTYQAFFIKIFIAAFYWDQSRIIQCDISRDIFQEVFAMPVTIFEQANISCYTV